MKILHVAPHLGGGVGKAHAAISAALPKEVVGRLSFCSSNHATAATWR